jgi:hypothetical protein
MLNANGAEGDRTLRGRVLESGTGKPIPARVYVRSSKGKWFFVRSDSDEGSAVPYRKQRGPRSIEMHTTLSAHPFIVDVPPGRYTVRAERGTEWTTAEQTVEVAAEDADVELRLERWADMARAGWFSGDTHVHRSLEELPNVMLAEDLNVALPLTYWVTKAYEPPRSARVSAEPIAVDATHVIYPVNTEYEIFSVGAKRHTLGAVFILGHKTPFPLGAPPVAPIAARARDEGALLDLDKHSWPWSLMLVPVMGVDLFELTNNHVWRTEFFFRQWTREALPADWNIEHDEGGLTERGWVDFGLKTYYALLNCGFRMRPTAGTASGVHPVPLGFGRVYVHTGREFSYARWMAGLSAGRSFVTTGPMLTAEVAGKPPGSVLRWDAPKRCRITGEARSLHPPGPVEIIVNGRVVSVIKPQTRKTDAGAYAFSFDAEVDIDGSSWVALRTFEQRPGGRFRFAHTAPWRITIPGKPLRPRRREVAYFIDRMTRELKRNEGILRPAELDEYRQALAAYQKLAEQAE